MRCAQARRSPIYKVEVMVSPGMLDAPRVKNWLGGIVPAWTALEWQSISALRQHPSHDGTALRIAKDLTSDDITFSAVASAAITVLNAASTPTGLKLTATGNLSRQVVAEMWDQITWPGFNKEMTLAVNKVINEPDFGPLYFVRNLIHAAKLVSKRKEHIKTNQAGKRFLTLDGQPALQELLFRTAFWELNLGYFRGSALGGWPQQDVGVALWSLSVSAHDWTPPDDLTRLCTIPVMGVLEAPYDRGSYAFEGIILRHLVDFGLMEHRAETIPGERFLKNHCYRKSPLFDRFLKFDVKLERRSPGLH